MTLSGNSFGQTVHIHRASVHQAAKLVAALLRVTRITAGLAESNGSLPLGLWLTLPAGWLPRTGIGSGTLCSENKYGLPLPFVDTLSRVDQGKNIYWPLSRRSVHDDVNPENLHCVERVRQLHDGRQSYQCQSCDAPASQSTSVSHIITTDWLL